MASKVARSSFTSFHPVVVAVGGMVVIAGWYAGHKTTNIHPERNVAMNSMPWHHDADDHVTSYKYKYHKGGDHRNDIVKAPGALSSKTVNVKLSDDLHKKFHKEE